MCVLVGVVVTLLPWPRHIVREDGSSRYFSYVCVCSYISTREETDRESRNEWDVHGGVCIGGDLIQGGSARHQLDRETTLARIPHAGPIQHLLLFSKCLISLLILEYPTADSGISS